MKPSKPKHWPAFGWDEAGGWVVYCECGFTSGTSPFAANGAEEFDDHMRLEGILQEE